MKRSEVLKLIEGLYKLEIQNFPKENPSDLFAENLLSNLEQLGMLPPLAKTEKTNFSYDKNGVYEYPIYHSYWEPEEKE